jgi:hypothetical protein
VLDLAWARISGNAERGAVDLTGAYIGGQLVCSGAELRNDSGPALAADGLQVEQHLFLTGGFTATSGGAYVAVDLLSARVGRTLVFDQARLEHATNPHRLLQVMG